MSNQMYVTLNNGVKMPIAGIGTFLLSPDEAKTSVLSALKDGSRQRILARTQAQLWKSWNIRLGSPSPMRRKPKNSPRPLGSICPMAMTKPNSTTSSI